MRKLLVATIVVSLVEAQRSSYASRPGSNSKLLPRYRKNETDPGLGSRAGEEASSSSSTLSPDLEGTLEDQRFVHRVSQWPEDRQPFWYKNRHAISSMRDRDIDGRNSDQPNFENERPRSQFQSSFQGRGRVRVKGQAKDVVQFVLNDASYNDDFTNHPLLLHLRRVHNG